MTKIAFRETRRNFNALVCLLLVVIKYYFLTYGQHQHCEDDVEQIWAVVWRDVWWLQTVSSLWSHFLRGREALLPQPPLSPGSRGCWSSWSHRVEWCWGDGAFAWVVPLVADSCGHSLPWFYLSQWFWLPPAEIETTPLSIKIPITGQATIALLLPTFPLVSVCTADSTLAKLPFPRVQPVST